MSKERESQKRGSKEQGKMAALIEQLYAVYLEMSTVQEVWDADKNDIERAIQRCLRERDISVRELTELDINTIERYLLEIIFQKFMQK